MEPIKFEKKTLPPFDIYIEEGAVFFGAYGNGDTAIEIIDFKEGPYSTATVNLEDYGLHPRTGHVFIKDYSEGAGLWRFLVEIGVIGEPVRKVSFGPYDASAQECPLLV